MPSLKPLGVENTKTETLWQALNITGEENVMTSKLKVINMFGGPGCSKSTTRAHLFSLLKQARVNVEEVTEYAKDVTWDENQALLSDQLFVLANQNRRLHRLQNKVEWAVSDSPLLLSIHYVTPNYLPVTFSNLVYELWDTYENINYRIRRVKPYSRIGRSQTFDEAKKIDEDIQCMLDSKGIPYTDIDGDTDAAFHILGDLVKNHGLSVSEHPLLTNKV